MLLQEPGDSKAVDQQAGDLVEALQASAAGHRGSPEEAVALFAAVLRSQGLLVRTVR